MAEVELTIENHLAHVRLNRDRARNAISVSMDRELAEIWRRVDEDRQVWAVVLSSAGKVFCAGADLYDLDERSKNRIAIGGGLTGLGGPRLALRKPLIASVQGPALASGFELAMCADIIIAARSARFAIPEAQIGVIAEAGILHRVTRQLPHHVAMGMVLAGMTLDADQALHYGLVNEVCDLEDLEEVTRQWADRVLACSPLVSQAAKQAIDFRQGWPLDVAISTRYESIETYASTADARESRAALAERRDPRWSGG
ncbi:enoyl-CoA hydratase/isomerase family protein [Qaidamihabitans albus]|uniref:enoyl-CoA hydratase/isomerase family protein n=1 Tax=Qaidamihabitans albus TaxID=2795733 RepID=UPI0018F1B0F6|nr:enoyl-CoA hydratase-related protein [Qaidamihabitans albus]